MMTTSHSSSSSSSAAPRRTRSPGVQLPEGVTASALLHRLLQHAVERHPELKSARVPEEGARFRSDFAETLVRFEGARAASSTRSAIAASIADEAHAAFTFVAEDGTATTLDELFRSAVEPLATKRAVGGGRPGLRPCVPYRGHVYEAAELGALGEQLVERSLATRAAARSLAAIAAHAQANGGVVDLSGRKVVVLGANAELSPVSLFLESGAEVLWIDLAPPPEALVAASDRAGTLTFADRPADLLVAPHVVARTIERFAAGAPVDIVLAAYAPGSGREWRLQAAMNALVRALDASLVRGVGLYISPTTPSVLPPGEEDAAARRRDSAPAWQRALAATGALRGAPFVSGDVHVARALVPLQGVSYQAAQYVEKILAAERFAVLGTRAGAPPPRVSPNVAPITATRSLEHPLFQAGFVGAAHLGVEVFAPETTRSLSGLLLVADLLGLGGPAAPTAGDVFARQVHGGVFSMAYGLNEAIRVAAVLGMTSRPSLLWNLITKR